MKRAKPRKERTIERIRKAFGGAWVLDRDRNEYRRSDGLIVSARSHCNLSVGGCEQYVTRWYLQIPARLARTHQGDVRIDRFIQYPSLGALALFGPSELEGSDPSRLGSDLSDSEGG